MSSDWLVLKGFDNWGDTTLTDQLAQNLVSFFNNGFLNLGAFTNVTMNLSGYYGGDFSRLRPVNDPNFADGRVFEGFRSQWVYESGISYNYQPISISGVYVSGVFCPTSGLAYSHHIDYTLGRVVFDNPINQSIPINIEFPYRNVFATTSEAPWFRQIQTNSLRVDNNQFLQGPSGAWDTLAQSRVQLPAVVIEPTTRITLEPMQLGGGQFRNQDVLCHVVAETPWERNKLTDIILSQKDKTIYLYDLNKVVADEVWALNFDGSPNPSGLQYPQLVDPGLGYRKYNCLFYNAVAQDVMNPQNLFVSSVRLTCKIQVDNI
jgi:hypothetical protein